ncbi:MAG: TRAP transporter substrate-binding protein [Deltaproteobacteria bacterium]|nr:TRAP transporter substrate-binding protein [Deltaproteobacteria bacterium]
MMAKRQGFFWLSIVTLILFFGSKAWSAETFELKGGTEGNIKHPYAQAGQNFAKIVEAKSGGKIKAKWFHTGQIGGGLEILNQLQSGTIQFATLSNANTGTINPKMMTMYTPYLIKDWDALFNKWVGSEGAKLILDGLNSKGIMGLGWVPYGFNALCYVDPAIRKIEDCKGRKIRAAESYTIKGTLEALGCNAPPIPWPEVYQSIQQKVVEGCTTPPGMLMLSRLDEVVKNLTLSDHLFGAHVFFFREETFKKFPADLQKIVVDSVLEACRQQQNEMKDLDEKSVESMKQKGIKIWTLSSEEKARWIAATKKVYFEHEKRIDQSSGDGRAFMRTVFKSLGRDYDKEILGN